MLSQVFDLVFSPSFIASVLRITAPILFAALGGLMARRCGIMNLALEGMMLTSALVAVLVSAAVNGAMGPTMGTIAGFIGGTLAGVVMAMFLAYMAIQLKANIYLSGLAINTIATGGTVFVLYMASGDKAISGSLRSTTMPVVNIPIIKDIPIIGELLSGHNIMVYFAFFCVFITYIIVMRTQTGLRIRAVGENPDAAESVGVNVKKVQFQAMALSGLFCGFGGVSLSMAYVSFFSRGMTAGRGFIGMSAMNLGNAAPVGTMVASLIFGVFDALSNVLQSLSIPVQFLQALPYAATLVALVIFAVQSDAKLKRIKAKQAK